MFNLHKDKLAVLALIFTSSAFLSACNSNLQDTTHPQPTVTTETHSILDEIREDDSY